MTGEHSKTGEGTSQVSGSVEPSGPTPLVRNTLYNLVTQGGLIVVALAAMPVVVGGLGAERFGLLSLIWILVGYFSLLDLGISRANAKYLAEALVLDDERRVRSIVWNSLAFGFAVGLGSGVLLVFLAPVLINHVLGLSGPLSEQAMRGFLYSAVGLPFVVVFGVIRGIQTAYQRFGLLNIFQGIVGFVQWFGAALIISLGAGLDEVLVLTVGVRVLVTIAAFLTLPRTVDRLFYGAPWDRALMRKLLGYGSWVTVSQLVSPLYLYLDRLFIGALLSLAAVTWYTVPQEGLSRLLIVPMSLTATLFPVMSGQSALNGLMGRSSLLYARAVKYLLLVMLPMTLVLIAFGRWILSAWMGEAFADTALPVFQILAGGLFFNALAQVPVMALLAYSRPDLIAKFHVIEFPLMIGLNLWLLPLIGVTGAAIAWTVRVIVDALLLFIATKRTVGLSLRMGEGSLGKWSFPGHMLFAAVSIAVALSLNGLVPRVVFVAVCVVSYAILTWKVVFDASDRQFFLGMRAKIFGAV